MMTNIEKGSKWQHGNGCVYKVLHIANIAHVNPKYPASVVYQGVHNDNVWVKTKESFLESMTMIAVTPKITGYYAFFCDEDDYELWHFVTKKFWDKNGHLPDADYELDIPNFSEAMESTWQTYLSYEEAKAFLIEYGFEIMDCPINW